MPLISATIPNLINGVSQQPPPTRISTACEEAVNSYMSVVSGLQKRQNSKYISSLSATAVDDISTHLIKRSNDDKQIFIASNTGLEAFDIESGNQLTVSYDASALSYLTSGKPNKDLRFVTIADQVFVLNKSVIVRANDVAETSEERKDPSKMVSVFIKRAVASTTYAVYVNNILAFEYGTKSNTTADDALEGTAKIAEGLLNSAKKTSRIAGIAYTGSTETKDGQAVHVPKGRVVGSIFTFEKTNATDRITVLDQFGGAAMRVIEDTVQDFSDLPPNEEEGRLVKIVGDADAEGDDYWVRFDGKVWVESYGWKEGREIDPTTMPHKIVPTENGLTFSAAEWGSRNCGGNESNSDPTFVNNTINNVFLYKGRMGFLTDENLVMSEVAKYENFFRTTVTQLIDTDRIDVASTTGKVNILRHAVAFGDSLVLFSDSQQFKVTQGDILSPATVGLQPTTSYDGSRHVPPVNSGPNVFFAVDGPRFSIVREMYIDENNGEQFNAAEITIQIPKYIPTGTSQLAVSTYEDALVLLSENRSNTIFIYKWFLEGKTKVQSSWSKWEFDENVEIRSLGFLDQDLIMVYKLGSQLLIDRVRLEEAVALSDEAILLLDHQTDADQISPVYDAVSDQTTFTLPFTHPGTFEFWTVANPHGIEINVQRGEDGKTYTASGNWTLDETGAVQKIAAGLPINFEFTFSDQFVRNARSGGEISVQDGRLQLRYMSVVYQNSSYFEAEVTPKNRRPRRYIFTARTLSDSTNVLDAVPIETGEFRFPITAQNTKVQIKLKSNKPFPCAFGVVEWDALYHPRTQRI